MERVFSSMYKTREDAKSFIVNCIEMFYNDKRRHSYLGLREFEKKMTLKKAA